MGLGLLSWVWVWVCRGSRLGFTIVGCRDRGLRFFFFLVVLMVEEGGVNDLDFYLFIYLLLLMVDYGLLVVVVSGVSNVVVVGLW